MTQNVSYHRVYKISTRDRCCSPAAPLVTAVPQSSRAHHIVTVCTHFTRLQIVYSVACYADFTKEFFTFKISYTIPWYTNKRKFIYAHKAVRYSVCQLLRISPVLNRVLCRFLLPNFLKIAYQMWKVRIKEQLCP